MIRIDRPMPVYNSDLFDMTDIQHDRLIRKLKIQKLTFVEISHYLHNNRQIMLLAAELVRWTEDFEEDAEEYLPLKNTLQLEWEIENCGWEFSEFMEAFIEWHGWTVK